VKQLFLTTSTIYQSYCQSEKVQFFYSHCISTEQYNADSSSMTSYTALKVH